MVNLADRDRYDVKIFIVASQELKFQRSGWLAVGMSLRCHKALLANVAGEIAVPV